MPILVKTSNKHSSVHGLGLFAAEDIPKGTIWWVGDNSKQSIPSEKAPNAPNEFFDRENVHQLIEGKTAEEVSEILQHTMYYDEAGLLIHLRDGTGVLNHSFEFNSQMISNR